ncbi:MAG: hypothetical protein M0R21_12545 [Lentimicrobiaceae bacterium]|nr:hypothetical protein [Lentimicrobiaceae bacterium]
MKTLKTIGALLMLVAITLVSASVFADHSTGIVTAGMAAAAMRDRQIWKTVMQKAKELSGGIPSPSYLRVEQTLTNTASRYNFNLKAIGGESITEVKLDRNDLFVVSDIAVYLLCQTNAKIGKDVLQTYPNKQVFPAVSGFDPDDLEAIYNGWFTLKIGSTVNVEKMSMQNFRLVPQTQQSSSSNKSQYTIVEASYKLGSLLYLYGTMDINATIEIPTFDGIQIQAVTSGFTHKIVFHPYGYLAKGAAVNAQFLPPPPQQANNLTFVGPINSGRPMMQSGSAGRKS